MEILPHAGKAEILWRVHFESPVECAAQCLVRREGVEHGVLLVISMHEYTPDVPGKRLMVSRLASQGCEDGDAQALVVGIMLVAAAAAVLVFLDAEGVGEDRRAIAVGEAAQHALAVGVGAILLLVGGVGGPLGEVVQDVVGEGVGCALGRAAGDVAKAIVAADAVAGGLGAVVRAGGPALGGIESDELMGVAGAIQVLLLGAAPVERALPQLAQVRVDVRIAVAGPRQAVARPTATGAIARRRGCPRVARPHDAVLLVVAERFGLPSPPIGGVRHGCLRGGKTGYLLRRVVVTRL